MPEAIYTETAEQDTDYGAPSVAYEEPGYFSQLTQEYGRRAAAVVLAGGVALGLTGCEPGDQTNQIGMASTEKVLKIGGSQLVTGSCIEYKQTVAVGQSEREQVYSRCNAQPNELREQTVAQVSRASNGGKSYTIVQGKRDCSGPGASFVATVRAGDIISVKKENYRKFDEQGKITANETYCVWEKR